MRVEGNERVGKMWRWCGKWMKGKTMSKMIKGMSKAMYLTKEYLEGRGDPQKLAEELGWSVNQVRKEAHRLGVTRKRRSMQPQNWRKKK